MLSRRTAKVDASPISTLAAQARRDALDAKRPWGDLGQVASERGVQAKDDASTPEERAHMLTQRVWMIVAAGLGAWALIAIPAFLLLG